MCPSLPFLQSCGNHFTSQRSPFPIDAQPLITISDAHTSGQDCMKMSKYRQMVLVGLSWVTSALEILRQDL